MTVAEMIAERTAALQTELDAANAEITTMGGTGDADTISGLADAIGTIPQGSTVTVEPLSVTENGTYTAPTGKAYSPVTVNVPTGGSNPNVFVYEVPTTTGTLTITHSLGVAPTRAACICMDMDAPASGQKLIAGVSNVSGKDGRGIYYNSSRAIDAVNAAFTISGASETSLTFGSNRNFYGGSTYLFIFA